MSQISPSRAAVEGKTSYAQQSLIPNHINITFQKQNSYQSGTDIEIEQRLNAEESFILPELKLTYKQGSELNAWAVHGTSGTQNSFKKPMNFKGAGMATPAKIEAKKAPFMSHTNRQSSEAHTPSKSNPFSQMRNATKKQQMSQSHHDSSQGQSPKVIQELAIDTVGGGSSEYGNTMRSESAFNNTTIKLKPQGTQPKLNKTYRTPSEVSSPKGTARGKQTPLEGVENAIVLGHNIKPSSTTSQDNYNRRILAAAETQTHDADEFRHIIRESALDLTKGSISVVSLRNVNHEQDGQTLFRNQVLKSLQDEHKDQSDDTSSLDNFAPGERQRLLNEMKLKLKLEDHAKQLALKTLNDIESQNITIEYGNNEGASSRIGTVERIMRRFDGVKNSSKIQPSSVYFGNTLLAMQKELPQLQVHHSPLVLDLVTKHNLSSGLSSKMSHLPFRIPSTLHSNASSLNRLHNNNSNITLQAQSLQSITSPKQTLPKQHNYSSSMHQILHSHREKNKKPFMLAPLKDDIRQLNSHRSSISAFEDKGSAAAPTPYHNISEHVIYSQGGDASQRELENRSVAISHKHSQYLNRPILRTERVHKEPYQILTTEQMMQPNIKPSDILNKGIQRMIERRKMSFKNEYSQSEFRQPTLLARKRRENYSISADQYKRAFEHISQNESQLVSQLNMMHPTLENLNSAIQSQASTPQGMMQPTLGTFTNQKQLLKLKPAHININFRDFPSSSLNHVHQHVPIEELPASPSHRQNIIHSKRSTENHHKKAKSNHRSKTNMLINKHNSKLPDISKGGGSFSSTNSEENLHPQGAQTTLQDASEQALKEQRSISKIEGAIVIELPLVGMKNGENNNGMIEKPTQITFVDVSINSKKNKIINI